MNEITQIHLGRTAFTIAVDAQKMLRDYLAAVKKHMGANDEAVDEVESRMAELLTERGITGSKVVLVKDVEYLKSQLGEPGDFDDQDERSESESEREEPTAPKRLFRDPKQGMIAGVAAGLAAYFGVKPVVVRALFVLVLLTGFGGLLKMSLTGGFWLMVLTYCALWAAIPKASTGSDRLRMQGKPVTVDAIKDVVERADVKGAAGRLQHIVESMVHGVAKAAGGIVGIGLIVAGIAGIFGVIAVSVYWALNNDIVPAGIFPVGTSEVALVYVALLAAAAMALAFLLLGITALNRKWPLPQWVAGVIVAVILVSTAVGGALAADAAPKIRERYDALQRTYTRTVPEFNSLNVLGRPEVNVRYEESDTYGVTVKYWGDAKFSELTTEVKDQTLTVDARALAGSMRCKGFCPLHSSFYSAVVQVVIHGHKLQAVTTDLGGTQLILSKMHDQTLKVNALNSTVSVTDFSADTLRAKFDKEGAWTLDFAGAYAGTSLYHQGISLNGGSADITALNLDLVFEGDCGVMAELSTGPSIGVGSFKSLSINGELIGTPADLQAANGKPGHSPTKCVNLRHDNANDSL